jgi:hypothetical protein
MRFTWCGESASSMAEREATKPKRPWDQWSISRVQVLNEAL